MLQSQWTDSELVLRQVDPGPLPAGWVRLRVTACGIYGSDLHRYRGPKVGGTIPGHELCGTVLQAHDPMPDSLYAVEPWVSCGACDYCRSGRVQHCRSGRLVGAQIAGGLAEFIDVPATNVLPVAASLSALQASFTEPFAVCVRAVHLARLQLDSRILILGGGTLGLVTGLLARDRCAQVGITCRYPAQAEAARALGLEAVTEADAPNWATETEPDVVVETVGGHADTINQAIALARPGGRIVVLGLFQEQKPFDARGLVIKELSITGSKVMGISEHGPEFRAAGHQLVRFQAELAVMQTHQFPLTQVTDAFATAFDKRTGAIKVTVLP
jgi:threonine dehydrogenase-like Zn-dependent dehydrogenase